MDNVSTPRVTRAQAAQLRQVQIQLGQADFEQFVPQGRSTLVPNHPSKVPQPENRAEDKASPETANRILSQTSILLNDSVEAQISHEIENLKLQLNPKKSVIEQPNDFLDTFVQGANEVQTSIKQIRRLIPRSACSAPSAMANTTIFEVFNDTRQKAGVPKFVSPEIFTPGKNRAKEFIRTYERAAIANAWDNSLKIMYLGSFLEGIANRWYTRYVAKNPSKTWDDVKEDFVDEYGGENEDDEAEAKFENYKQREGESVQRYFYQLQTLAYDFDEDMNDKRFIKQFEKGLAPHIYPWYRTQKTSEMRIKDLKVIVERLKDIEDRQHTEKVEKPSQKLNENVQSTDRVSKQRPQPSSQYLGPYNPGKNWERTGQTSPSFRPQPQNHFRPKRPQQPFPFNQTRTYMGQPKCYICGRQGHYASSCVYQQPRQQRHVQSQQAPNDNGRQN